MKKHKFKIMATSLQGNKSIYDIDYNKKVIIIGNESKGVSEVAFKEADEQIKIPMLGKAAMFSVQHSPPMLTHLTPAISIPSPSFTKSPPSIHA